MRKNQSNREKRFWSKASGEEKLYFVMHNALSMLFFFWYAITQDLFENQTWNLWDIFSIEFLKFTVMIFGFSIIFSYSARILSYLLIFFVYKYQLKETVKSFVNMNRGINAMFSYTYLMTTLISSIVFAIGAITLIQAKLFNQDSMLTFIGAYIITKAVIYLFAWVKWG